MLFTTVCGHDIYCICDYDFTVLCLLYYDSTTVATTAATTATAYNDGD